MSEYHTSVLLKESIEALNIKEDGIYIDATAGGGGHSAEILKNLSEKAKLVLIDRDPDAISEISKRFAGDKRVTIVRDNYKNIISVLNHLNIEQVDGIIADLGVSSHQLDTDSRGFSFHKNAPLDMRMSKDGISAKDIVNTYEQEEIKRILFEYADEKFAGKIANEIVNYRQNKEIETTFELAEIVKNAYPQRERRKSHPARKTFQALRIEVNGELTDLEFSVKNMFESLSVGGRLAIITFHSAEDRIVKNVFREFAQGCICPPEFPVCVCGHKSQGKIIVRKKSPSEIETEKNTRAKSARLRCIEKIYK
ncbi:MAG: 16S rRNA (cytosine(1402)-N(4))-methyltransferase RsmH [Clostridia bacterium]|nr:16S rRNA (cytosine(1402)-N(4))-methyltransferase RsmH [Clostridia bacterium]